MKRLLVYRPAAQRELNRMDRSEAERIIRALVVFWGGGVDTQQVLPFGTPGEVREQVLR